MNKSTRLILVFLAALSAWIAVPRCLGQRGRRSRPRFAAPPAFGAAVGVLVSAGRQPHPRRHHGRSGGHGPGRHRRRALHGNRSGRAARAGKVRRAAVARTLPTHLQRSAPARARSEHEQRRRLVRQRRAVDHAGALHAAASCGPRRTSPARSNSTRCCRSRRRQRTSIATSRVFAYPTPKSNYSIPHIRGKSAAVTEEIPLRTTFPVAGRRCGPRTRSHRESDGEARPGRPARVGRAGRRLDAAAAGPHDHRQGQSSRAAGRPRPGVRQAQQGGGRGPLQRPDGEAHRREPAAGGRKTHACLDAHR